jgi:drug/metabolite transporter (DMT)-like permease
VSRVRRDRAPETPEPATEPPEATPPTESRRPSAGRLHGARPGHGDEWDIEHVDPDPKGSRAMLLGLIIVSVLLAASAQIVLKHGMNHVTHELGHPFGFNAESLKTAGQTLWVWVGLALFGLSALVWLMVLSRAALSFAYPFAALTYVVIVLYDTVRGEAVGGLRWAGVALIFAGIILVSRTPSHS